MQPILFSSDFEVEYALLFKAVSTMYFISSSPYALPRGELIPKGLEKSRQEVQSLVNKKGDPIGHLFCLIYYRLSK